NDWLDEMHYVSSIKVDFSKILYENAYDKYEEYYYTEYIDLVETEEESDEEAVSTIEEEVKEVIEEAIEAETLTEQPFAEETKKPIEKQIEKLVTDFDEKTFWTDAKNQALQEFAEAENLKNEELKEVVNEY